MKVRSRNTRSQINLGRALLFSVILGLVFSNAEGIRLLPFPETPAANAADQLSAGDSLGTYSQSVQPGRSIQTKLTKTKNTDPVGEHIASLVPGLTSFSTGEATASAASPVREFYSLPSTPQVTRGPPSN